MILDNNLKRLFTPHLPNAENQDDISYMEINFSNGNFSNGSIIRWKEKFVNEKGEELIYQCKSCIDKGQKVIFFDINSDLEDKKKHNKSNENRLFSYFLMNDLKGNVYKNRENDEYINYVFDDSGNPILDDHKADELYCKAEAKQNDFDIWNNLSQKVVLDESETKVSEAILLDHSDFPERKEKKDKSNKENIKNAQDDTKDLQNRIKDILNSIIQFLFNLLKSLSELSHKFINFVSCNGEKMRGDHN